MNEKSYSASGPLATVAALGQPLGAELAERVNSELIRSLHRQIPSIVAAYLLFAPVLTIFLWGVTDAREHVLIWVALLLTLTAARIATYRTYLKIAPTGASLRRWGMLSALFSGAFGTTFAIAPLLFLDAQKPVTMAVLPTFICVVVLGASLANAPYRPGFLAFSVTAFGLLEVALLIQPEVNYTLAIVVLVSFLIAANYNRNLNRTIADSVRLGHENMRLREQAEGHSLQLEKMLAETRQARDSADRANAAKTRFLASASHDLRQPIHALRLFFECLSLQVSSPGTEPLIRQVNKSIKAADTMLNTLLDVSKLDAGIVVPRLGAVSLGQLFVRLGSEYQSTAVENANRLRIRDCPLMVQSDPTLLEVIIRNLLSNALRYTHQGAVLLAARKRGGTVRIEVRDTGIGIPAEEMDNIFVEFHQLGNPARDRSAGLGLGLAIVLRTANLLGHALSVESRVGVGSCFAVTAPLCDMTEITHPIGDGGEVVAEDELDAHGQTVLLLDDDTAILEAMSHLLRRWGCKVCSAATVEEAETLLRDRHFEPDLLIFDYRLRGDESGLQVANRLRRDYRPGLPAIMVTGDTAPDRLREARDSGYPVLHKPVQPQVLRAALVPILASHESG